MMRDIDDIELNEMMNKSNPVKQSSREISDEDLIQIVQNVKEGKAIRMNENGQIKNNFVEPEMPISQPQQMNQFIQSDNNSNFWKIEGLPSKAKFYKGVQILGRPMKVLEVKKISSLNEENGDFILNDIVRKTTTGIDINELYIADKLYIIFWLRANTYRESGFVIPFNCIKCNKNSDYHFDINNLEVQQISDNFDPNNIIKVGNTNITYDYLKIKDEIYIERFRELNIKAMGDIDNDILSMAQMVKTISGKEMTLLQKYNWIIELSPGEYSYLKTYIEKNGMGIKPLVTVTCKVCGGTAPVAVSFREDFFVPEFKFE